MADDATKQEPEKAEEKPVLDTQKPLSRQVDKILEQLPKEDKDDKSDEKKPEEVPAPAKEESEDAVDEKENVTAEDSPQETEIPQPDEIDVEVKELPSWQQYILDKLPEIQTIGHTGEGKDKVFRVKRVEDLPENFEFASKRDELSFSAALASQEVNARDLLKQYQNEEQQQKYQEFQNQEAIDIQADIKALQKEGVLDKFKYSEEDAEFNSDPAVKTANAIYDLYKKTNDAYLREFSQTGRNYRISFRDAADKYFARQGRQAPKPQARQERDKVATQVSAPQGASPDSQKRAMPIGSSMQDVLKLYKAGRI